MVVAVASSGLVSLGHQFGNHWAGLFEVVVRTSARTVFSSSLVQCWWIPSQDVSPVASQPRDCSTGLLESLARGGCFPPWSQSFVVSSFMETESVVHSSHALSVQCGSF